jgi:hypothetical protein
LGENASFLLVKTLIWDDEKVSNPKLEIAMDAGHVYQVGKRKFARIKLIVV